MTTTLPAALSQAKATEVAAEHAYEVARRSGNAFDLLQAQRRRAKATGLRRAAEYDADPVGFQTAQRMWEHQAINHHANSL